MTSSDGWKTCDSKNELYWPETDKCFNATERGPCGPNEMLVLRDDLNSPTLESACIAEPCFGYFSSKLNLKPAMSPNEKKRITTI